jgi:hypothetical protein
MTPLEIAIQAFYFEMARWSYEENMAARWEVFRDEDIKARVADRIDAVNEMNRLARPAAMRAALLALAACKKPKSVIKAGSQAIDWGGELCEDAETLFDAMLRAIATEGNTDV